jgi:predicted GH43/DUF377 family glycosyl hydrolase
MNYGFIKFVEAAKSKDLIKWIKLGIAFSHENKDVVLFPEKIIINHG